MWLYVLSNVLGELEQLEKGILTLCNPSSSLGCSFITGEPVEKRIQGTYSKEIIDGGKQGVCWWKWNLTNVIILIKRGTRMACVAHQFDCLTDDARERANNLHCRTEAADRSPTPIAIFLECFFTFLE